LFGIVVLLYKMTMSSPLFGSSATVTAVAIAIILLASSFTTINAQPQQLTSQPGEFVNGAGSAAVFQSTNDSFSIQVPDGWLAQDLNNTGTALQEEISRGYGLLAQLCQEEEQQQQQQAGADPPNATGGNSDTPTCQGAENNVIHIIRYPHLDTRLGANNSTNTTTNNITIDNVLGYHLQKLQEVGYSNIQVVNNTAVTVNLTNPQTNQTVRTEAANFVEMTYTTAAEPEEARTGYFILTYTDVTAPLPVPAATSPNLGTTKGYAVFYEGNSTANNTASATATTTVAGVSSSFAAASLPLTVAQVLNSFELTIAPEVAQALAQQEAQAVETIPEETTEDEEDAAEEDDGDDNGGDEDDGDDNGGDEVEEDLDDCIIIGTGNVEDDCDLTPDDDGDDDGGAGDDDGGAGDDDGGAGDDDGA
jgi:hypothetical protein